MFARVLRRLFPSGLAWRMPVGSSLRRLADGLGGGFDDAIKYIDDVSDDVAPTRTRQLAEWQRQFALQASGTEADQRQRLASRWMMTGGQGAGYIDSVLAAAGFDARVYDWWSSTSPLVVRIPLDYTAQALIGETQCGEPLALCGEPLALCDSFLASEVDYVVNSNLTREPPPQIPSDPLAWRGFVYICGETFGSRAAIPAERRVEFEGLLLQLLPADKWIVVLADYVSGALLVGDDYVTVGGAYVEV